MAVRLSENELTKLLSAGRCRVAQQIGGVKPAAASAPARAVVSAAQRQARRMPQEKLYEALKLGVPAPEWEYRNAIPGRRYRIDIAYPAARLAIEVEGWSHHGKHLNSFKKDHVRRNAFVLAGWRVLGFSAGAINADIESVVAVVQQALREQPRELVTEQIDPALMI